LANRLIEGCGLGQVEQPQLDGVDLAGQIGRISALNSDGSTRILLCIRDFRFLQTLTWGGRRIVDPCCCPPWLP